MNEITITKPEFSGEILAQVTTLGTINHNIKEAKEFALLQKQYYAEMVYTEESINTAKSERAKLNNMVKSIAEYRKDIMKEFKKPIDEFETLAKETESIINETSQLVDAQVKIFEEKEWELKKTIIFEYIGVNTYVILNTKWKNKGFELEDIYAEIDAQITQHEQEESLHEANRDIIKMYAESKGLNPDAYVVEYNYSKDVQLVKNKIDTTQVVITTPIVETPKVDSFTGEVIMTISFTGTTTQLEMLKKYARTIGMEMDK